MVRKLTIVVAFSLGSAFAIAQEVQDKDKPVQEKKPEKEIKNVPATGAKSKPAKISSAARPGSLKPNQPVQHGKPPAKGKPQGTGKPKGN